MQPNVIAGDFDVIQGINSCRVAHPRHVDFEQYVWLTTLLKSMEDAQFLARYLGQYEATTLSRMMRAHKLSILKDRNYTTEGHFDSHLGMRGDNCDTPRRMLAMRQASYLD